MIVRRFLPDFADRLVPVLRPVAFIILVGVIVFAVAISAEMVLGNLVAVGPAIWVLNATAMLVGWLLGKAIGANRRDSMTLAIEVGVHNVTLAIFLTQTVLHSLPLALTQNVYGVVMLLNGTIFVRLLRDRHDRGGEKRGSGMNLLVVSAEEVARCLPYEECIPLMREAMIALSQGRTRQLLRGIIDLPERPRLRRHAGRDARRRLVRRQAGQRLSREFRQGRQLAPGRRRDVRSRDRRAGGDPRGRRDHRHPHRRRLGRRHRRARPARRAPPRHPRLWRAGLAACRGDPRRAAAR